MVRIAIARLFRKSSGIPKVKHIKESCLLQYMNYERAIVNENGKFRKATKKEIIEMKKRLIETLSKDIS